MNPDRRPSLTPNFLPASRDYSRVITNVESPAPHRGWYSRGYLPHWDHPGMMQMLNFRLADSLPRSVIERWQMESVNESKDKAAAVIHQKVEKYLDAGYGKCWLRRPDVAQVVEETLLRFDGERYRLIAWCIMPNHIHTLIESREGFPLAGVLHSWKSFTAKAVDKILQRHGEFWEREYWERYIRNAEHFKSAVAYIEDNPVKAGLVRVKTDWRWSSAKFRAGSAGTLPARPSASFLKHAGKMPALPVTRNNAPSS